MPSRIKKKKRKKKKKEKEEEKKKEEEEKEIMFLEHQGSEDSKRSQREKISPLFFQSNWHQVLNPKPQMPKCLRIKLFRVLRAKLF